MFDKLTVEYQSKRTFDSSLVSVIVPCFNEGLVLQRFLDSLYKQTYRPIELVFVNDGSTDNSEEILLRNIEKFTESGITIKYIFQENSGLGGAIDTGLKHFSGEFFCWADPDDYYLESAFEKRVNALRANPGYSSLATSGYTSLEEDPETITDKLVEDLNFAFEDNQFQRILEFDIIFCPMCHMIRSKDFLSINPGRSIFKSRYGQDLQILLPVYGHYKRMYIDEPMFVYVVSQNSMSHKDKTLAESIEKCDGFEEICIETLRTMNLPKDKLQASLKLVQSTISKMRFDYGWFYKDYRTSQGNFNKLQFLGKGSLRDRFKVFLLKPDNPISRLLYKLYSFIY